MSKIFNLSSISVSEGKELLSGLNARLKQLDKSFKSCVMNDAQQAAENIASKAMDIKKLIMKIQEALPNID